MRRAVVFLALLSCGKSSPSPSPSPSSTSTLPSPSPSPSPSQSPPPPCPDDMSFVDTTFCPDVERKCLDMEHEHPNNLDICHRFAHEESCKTTEEERRFCIDRYEYPNEKGAHPVWMLTWYEAQATCESKGKRLCWASEWTAACEGPDHTPFPYGWERSSAKCNMDNMFINPIKGPGNFRFYSKDDAVRGPELARLDQSMPSGAMSDCTNGFGVFDMTGNLDEWVISDRPPRDKSKWAGLKGGAWGHVRSQCRPMTTSHEPEFYYYFVSFRCCRDAAGFTPWTPDGRNMPAPDVEAHDFAPDAVAPVNPSGPSAKKYSRTGKPE